jgi:hypothetical protein
MSSIPNESRKENFSGFNKLGARCYEASTHEWISTLALNRIPLSSNPYITHSSISSFLCINTALVFVALVDPRTKNALAPLPDTSSRVPGTCARARLLDASMKFGIDVDNELYRWCRLSRVWSLFYPSVHVSWPGTRTPQPAQCNATARNMQQRVATALYFCPCDYAASRNYSRLQHKEPLSPVLDEPREHELKHRKQETARFQSCIQIQHILCFAWHNPANAGTLD